MFEINVIAKTSSNFDVLYTLTVYLSRLDQVRLIHTIAALIYI